MSMNELNTQLDYLAETKNLLKTAITDKGQNIEDNTPFRDYVEKVNDISTLNTETADATASAYELLNGRTAYVKGKKITGTLTTSDMAINGTTKFTQDDTVLPLIRHYPAGTFRGEVVYLKKSQIDMSVLEGKQYTIIYYERKFTTSSQASDIGLRIIVFNDDTTKYARNSTGLTIFSYSGENEANMTVYSATYDMEGHSINDFKWSDFKTETKSSNTISTSNASGTFYIYNTADYTPTTGLTQSTGFMNMNDKYLLQKTALANNVSQFYAAPNTNIYTPIDKDTLATSIGLTSDKLLKGSKVLNVTGTLEAGIDTSDANATASDIAQNKTAYINGEKVTGTLPIVLNGAPLPFSVDTGTSAAVDSASTFMLGMKLSNDTIIRTGKNVMHVPYSEITNAAKITADKIVKGNTILGVEGSAESGVDTSDATATENDITQNKTAYVNGTKVTGVIDTYSGSSFTSMPGSSVTDNCTNPQGDPQAKYVRFLVKPAYINGSFSMPAVDSKPICFKENAELGVLMSQSSVAEAIGLTADKIVSGNTILSIAGTAETGIDTSDGTATASDIAKGITAYVNGEKITGTLFTVNEGVLAVDDNKTYYKQGDTKILISGMLNSDTIIRAGAGVEITVDFTDLAKYIGLTPDVLKKDVTIFGVTGTYEAEQEAQEQIQTLSTTISNSNTLAEDILGTTNN